LTTPIVTTEAYEFALPEHKQIVGKFERREKVET
jgi:hypothetical protein